LPKGKNVVLVGNMEEASRLSSRLWDMSQQMVPHGTVGIDEDEDLDPVIIAIASYDGPREILILASRCEIGKILPSNLIIELVPQDAESRQNSRARYRRYQEEGYRPQFVSWTEWTGG
jgi:DNA polymerase IIIc chi subunit